MSPDTWNWGHLPAQKCLHDQVTDPEMSLLLLPPKPGLLAKERARLCGSCALVDKARVQGTLPGVRYLPPGHLDRL